MSDLLAHIRSLNAETRAWINECPGRWAGLIPEDLDFWASRGVTTAEEYDRFVNRQIFSDCYKDAHGVRPTGDWSDDEIDAWLSANTSPMWQGESVFDYDDEDEGILFDEA